MRGNDRIAVVGGGPAGLRAAEVAANGGAEVSVFDAKRSVGRKLLVAGYGGLNITHGESLDRFLTRYSGPDLPASFSRMIEAFTPNDLRDWASELGIETFQQRTGRVYPKEMKAAPLLRRWVARLRSLGVEFHPNHPLDQLSTGAKSAIQLGFSGQESKSFDAVILALGGASWQKTGSDGRWVPLLEDYGIELSPFEPANCGWEHAWPAALAAEIEGKPLKNVKVSAGGVEISGEVMLTRYGLEAGAIYQLGPALRSMAEPVVTIDLKPAQSQEVLLKKMESVRRDFLASARERWKLPEHAVRLLEHLHGPFASIEDLVGVVKKLRIPLSGPRPIDEAISSAGGVAWKELEPSLMLRKLPGVFLAGEMIDWEAPTGGYLVQACFATGGCAAKGALSYCQKRQSSLRESP